MGDYYRGLYKGLCRGYIGIIENKMETTIYWGYIRDYMGDYYRAY